MCVLFFYNLGCSGYLTRITINFQVHWIPYKPRKYIKHHWNINIRGEHFRFSPVLGQNKQPNRIFFSSIFWTKPTMFGSVRVFSLPNPLQPKIISDFFHLSNFFKDFIFVLFLILQICAFYVYFLRNLGFLNKYDTFFNWLGIHDLQKIQSRFSFYRSLPKN